jgi:hypothetical protein
MWIDNVWHGRAWSWDKMPWLIKTWKQMSNGKPICLKGIQSVEDAKRAVDYDFDGIVVSNHAGRQVDGAVASLDALERIVDGMFIVSYLNVAPFTHFRQLSAIRRILCSTREYVAHPMFSKLLQLEPNSSSWAGFGFGDYPLWENTA